MRTNTRHRKPAAERQRAIQALALRCQGLEYADISARLGWRTEGAARHAVDRLLSKREAEAAGRLRQIEGKRLDRLQAGIWDKAVAGNVGAVLAVLKIQERRSKLFGLDSPIAVAIGISASEFAERASELLKVVGVEPLRELAGLPALPPAPVEDDDDTGPWSNIADDMPCGATDYAPDTDNDLSAEPPDQAHQADTDTDLSPEVIEAEVVAELVEDDCGCGGTVSPLPRGQRRIDASRVLTADGVPLSRSGYARRFGGYDPLAGWAP